MLILIAEDNAANRELLREALTARDHAVVEAVNGEEALRMIEQSSPDLVMVDIQMPRVDGYEVLRRVRADAQWSATKMIAVTAFAMRGERERALAAGFDGYISKPIALAALYLEMEKVFPRPEHELPQRP
jgi:two-component system cell cycle response regulator DivK